MKIKTDRATLKQQEYIAILFNDLQFDHLTKKHHLMSYYDVENTYSLSLSDANRLILELKEMKERRG